MFIEIRRKGRKILSIFNDAKNVSYKDSNVDATLDSINENLTDMPIDVTDKVTCNSAIWYSAIFFPKSETLQITFSGFGNFANAGVRFTLDDSIKASASGFAFPCGRCGNNSGAYTCDINLNTTQLLILYFSVNQNMNTINGSFVIKTN